MHRVSETLCIGPHLPLLKKWVCGVALAASSRFLTPSPPLRRAKRAEPIGCDYRARHRGLVEPSPITLLLHRNNIEKESNSFCVSF